MPEHPIIFNSEMVRAILDGRKTQTRRIIRPEPFRDEGEKQWVYRYPSRNKECLHFPNATDALRDLCPYGKVGDTLWVRETTKLGTTWPPIASVEYIADGTKLSKQLTEKDWKKFGKRKYPDRHLDNIPSIHMFKSCARIFLEVTNIRVERVQDISLEDCKAEGVSNDPTEDWLELFMELWDSLNAKRSYSWDKNPWCWCISFKQLPERK